MSDIDLLKSFVEGSGGATAAPAAAVPPTADNDILRQFVEPEGEKYGTVGQQAIAGLEGVARGATLGGSDVLERASGITTPEAIRGRKEQNPFTEGIGNLVGSGLLLGATGGLGAAGEAIAGGAGLAAKAAAGVGEGALFGAGSAVSDAALGDPDLSASKIATQVGLGAVLGLGAGALSHGIESAFGKTGAVKGSIADAIGKEASSATKEANASEAVAQEAGIANPRIKEHAPEIVAAANRLKLPIAEGMVSADPWVQRAEDALVRGAPTYTAIKREQLYTDAYDGVSRILSDVAPESALSKADTGKVLQDGLAGEINAEAEPFNELYSMIKEDTENIPLKERSAPAIARNIMKIPEVRRGFKSPAAQLARDVAEEIQGEGVRSVDDLRAYQTDLGGRLEREAPPNEKRILSLVRDKLDDWERRTIKNHAENFISGIEDRTDISPIEKQQVWGDKIDRMKTLLGRIDEADAQYAPFRKKLTELAQWLGKNKIAGAKDAISFVTERLEPEELIKKLADKKYSGLAKFMEENFPEQMAVVREFQKGELRKAATLTDGFSPNKFLDKVQELEPEIRKAIFSPDELQRINDARTYLKSFPKNFNPSGTQNKKLFTDAFTALAESPVGMSIANARDLGIERFIKTAGAIPEELRPNPIEVGAEAAQKFNAMNAVQRIADKTDKAISSGIHAIITGVRASPSPIISGLTHSYDDRVKRITELAENPRTLDAHVGNHVDGLAQNLPTVSASLAAHIPATVSFLNSKIPKDPNQLPFSRKWEPSKAAKQKFDQYYDAVANPAVSLKHVKDGTLTLDQMEALHATHPALLKQMQNQIRMHLSPDVGAKLPFHTKQSLSMFLEMPLSISSMQPVRAANQMTFAQQGSPKQGAASAARPSKAGISKLDLAGRSATKVRQEETSTV